MNAQREAANARQEHAERQAQQAFENQKVGYSSALVIFQFGIFLIVAGVVLSVRKYIRLRNSEA
jgi:ABC-type sugar transport system permease subunit